MDKILQNVVFSQNTNLCIFLQCSRFSVMISLAVYFGCKMYNKIILLFYLFILLFNFMVAEKEWRLFWILLYDMIQYAFDPFRTEYVRGRG